MNSHNPDSSGIPTFLRTLLALFLVSSVVASIWLFIAYAIQSIRVSMAHDQITIVEEMRQRASETHSESEAAGYLQYAIHYYPSGTKQIRGSQLDEMVEISRRGAIRDMIARLRLLTGRDLGEDPEAWIKAYGDKNSAGPKSHSD
jgi:hypothetical protein